MPSSETKDLQSLINDLVNAHFAAGYEEGKDDDGRTFDALDHETAEEALKAYVESLKAQLAASQRDTERLRERLKLVDNVCHAHHAASLVTWDDICPVCVEAGGTDFYVENALLYRAPSPTGPAV